LSFFYKTPGLNNAAFIKQALHMMGILNISARMRAPHPAFSETDLQAISTVLGKAGLLEFYCTITV